MAASAITLKVAVLALFHPTQVTLAGAGPPVAVELRAGRLLVDGAARESVRAEGAPFVTVAVLDRGRTRIVRRFRGAVEARAAGNEIALVDELPEEEYLPGTVALEAGGDHPQMLAAQAVLARTFARRARHAGADLCDLTHCQTYRGADGETEPARAAAAATRGEVLTFQGRLAEAYFGSACGGATADVRDVWDDRPALPYLRSVPCDLCRGAPDRAWRAELPLAAVDRALEAGGRLAGLSVLDRGAGGWVRRVRLDGDGRELRGEALRVSLGRKLGWDRVRSARFSVSRHGDSLAFQGTGSGHGVGLCEAGAAVLARKGASYKEILLHYFPGTEVASAP